MPPARPSLVLLAVAMLTIAACETQKKPLTGFDKQPPGSIVLDRGAPGTGAVSLWPMFDLPLEPHQIFRPRLSGQDAVVLTSDEGFYDYEKLYLQGWTAGWASALSGVPPGTYVVELVDASGQSWGQSAPLAISESGSVFTPGVQLPTIVFAHFDDKVASWTIDPALRDADPATDEITVTSLVSEDVVVERCLIASGSPTSCTPVGTVAPGSDLRTVETVAGSLNDDHQALRIRLASDASPAYLRELDEGSGNFGSPACQIERIIFHGKRSEYGAVAMSSCYGFQSGPP
ncbi:MAG TPA: hypothetical protein VIQ54_19160 [Polyangia bacterium]